MPTYTFRDTITDQYFEVVLRISELDEFKESNPEYERVITPSNIVATTASNFDSITDDGWKENLQRIAEAHPTSALADKYGANKTHKQLKTEKLVRKHLRKNV